MLWNNFLPRTRQIVWANSLKCLFAVSWCSSWSNRGSHSWRSEVHLHYTPWTLGRWRGHPVRFAAPERRVGYLVTASYGWILDISFQFPAIITNELKFLACLFKPNNEGFFSNLLQSKDWQTMQLVNTTKSM